MSGGVVLTEAERQRDRLSDEETAARDWWRHYQDWQLGLWIVRDRRQPAYRSVATDEETAKQDAARWPGDYYAEPVERPRLAAQAGRVAEVVETVHLAHELVDGGVIPLYQCAAQGCEWTCDRIEFSPTEAVQLHAAHLGAVVAAELEADHG